jgi:hypothetical protein
VALIQQLGRVLRSFPGKTTATILDPHGLLESSVVPGRPDAIGDLEAAAEEEAEGKPRAKGEPQEPEERLAVAVAESTAWARTVLLEMTLAGAIEPKVSGSGWRHFPATSAQLSSLDRMAKAWARYLPEDLRAGIAALRAANELHPLHRGAVSDLLSILHAVARQAPEGGWEARRDWPGPTWPAGMALTPAPEVAGELVKAKARDDRQRRKQATQDATTAAAAK